MFDFLAHWFAKTETIVNNHGVREKIPPKTHYKNGHFSLDLTFICIILIMVICFYIIYRVKLYFKNKYQNNNSKININTVELQDILPAPRSQSNVVRAPKVFPYFGRAPEN